MKAAFGCNPEVSTLPTAELMGEEGVGIGVTIVANVRVKVEAPCRGAKNLLSKHGVDFFGWS